MRLILLLLTPIFLFAQYTTTADTYTEGDYYIDEVDQEDYYNPYYDNQEGYITGLEQTEPPLPNIEETYDNYSNYDYGYGDECNTEYTVEEDTIDTSEENSEEPSLNNLGLIEPFNTYNFSQFRSKKTPSLFGSDGMLKNLDSSYWFLKFYGHPDIDRYNLIQLLFKDSILTITVTDLMDNVVEESSYYLSPVKMIKPNEGIFVYSDKKGYIYFIYLRLLLPHLLAMEMVSSFEEAEMITDKSITELGVFVLQ